MHADTDCSKAREGGLHNLTQASIGQVQDMCSASMAHSYLARSRQQWVPLQAVCSWARRVNGSALSMMLPIIVGYVHRQALLLNGAQVRASSVWQQPAAAVCNISK
jgi:hypothetical protein